jgi:hypothetical protein
MNSLAVPAPAIVAVAGLGLLGAGLGLYIPATNAAVLHLALSSLPPAQRRALAAAVPALGAVAQAVDRLAGAAGSPADPDLR